MSRIDSVDKGDDRDVGTMGIDLGDEGDDRDVETMGMSAEEDPRSPRVDLVS